MTTQELTQDYRWASSRTARKQARVGSWLLYLVLFLGGLMFIIPIIWLVLGSIKVDTELRAYPVFILPSTAQWSNYQQAVTVIPYFTYMLRSFLLAAVYAILTVVSSAFVGFGFARLHAPGRDFLFLLVVSMMIVPGIVLVIPQYVLYSRYGIIDTYWPWILWGLTGAPFHIFLFRQFFLTFPDELEDAAEIDGCDRLRIFWQVFLPNARAPIIVALIFSFNWVWGDFFSQSLFLSSNNATLAMRLATAYNNPQGYPIYSLTMAGVVIYVLPLIIVFFLGQRYFVEGIVTTGLKG
jgi:multiple sugar transport system permease protein